ncbi:MAG: VWA domain-containing protein [Bacillota bacterium]|nr:VWA domain-containing protein [Bacillota bacterium]
MSLRPGGKLANRTLDFIFVVDCSTSMKQMGKMDALNEAIRNAIPHMQRVAEENPNASIKVRVLKFSSGAEWHIEEATPIESFVWHDLEAGGVTDMGKAFELLADAVDVRNMAERALPPVLVLVSDGQPTDEYKAPLQRFLELPWGTKAVKLAIAIGRGANEKVLKSFINSEAIEVLKAEHSHHLIEYIKWASTVVLNAASSPSSQSEGSIQTNVLLPAIPNDFWKDYPISVDDVW